MSGRCRKGRGIRKAQSCFVHVHVQVGINDVCSLARGLSIAIHGPVARLLHHLCLPPRPLSPTSRLRERLLESLSAKGKVTFRE